MLYGPYTMLIVIRAFASVPQPRAVHAILLAVLADLGMTYAAEKGTTVSELEPSVQSILFMG